jgi:hypothetical protein
MFSLLVMVISFVSFSSLDLLFVLTFCLHLCFPFLFNFLVVVFSMVFLSSSTFFILFYFFGLYLCLLLIPPRLPPYFPLLFYMKNLVGFLIMCSIVVFVEEKWVEWASPFPFMGALGSTPNPMSLGLSSMIKGSIIPCSPSPNPPIPLNPIYFSMAFSYFGSSSWVVVVVHLAKTPLLTFPFVNTMLWELSLPFILCVPLPHHNHPHIIPHILGHHHIVGRMSYSRAFIHKGLS